MLKGVEIVSIPVRDQEAASFSQDVDPDSHPNLVRIAPI